MASGKGHPWFDGGRKRRWTATDPEYDEQALTLSRSVRNGVTYTILKPVYDQQPEENEWERR